MSRSDARSRWTRGAAALLLCAAAVTFAGCATPTGGTDAANRSEQLWSERVPYVGSNSAVAALVSSVGPAPAGSYTISLATETPPYALTVHLARSAKPFSDTDFTRPAVLLLALVGNLDEVSFVSSGQRFTLTSVQASSDLGYDVKDLGRDRDALTRYVEKFSD